MDGCSTTSRSKAPMSSCGWTWWIVVSPATSIGSGLQTSASPSDFGYYRNGAVSFSRAPAVVTASSREQGYVQFALNESAQSIAVPSAHPEAKVPELFLIGADRVRQDLAVDVDVPPVGQQR